MLRIAETGDGREGSDGSATLDELALDPTLTVPGRKPGCEQQSDVVFSVL